MDALRAGLAGIDISGEQEPAHYVLDKACNIYESNTSKYVSRSHEIQGTTKNRELTFEKGSLVLKSGDDKMSSLQIVRSRCTMLWCAVAYHFSN